MRQNDELLITGHSSAVDLTALVRCEEVKAVCQDLSSRQDKVTTG